MKSWMPAFAGMTGWIVATFFFFITPTFAAPATPLPADHAFAFSLTTTPSGEWKAEWRIAPGYYLYRQHLHIKADPASLLKSKIVLPVADKFYSGTLSIPLHIAEPAQGRLIIDYQGCSQQGFCYPPVHKEIILPAASSLQAWHAAWALLLFVGLGLVLAFTPCVLPMVPILASIVVGHHAGTGRKAFLLSLAYVSGMALTYAIAGIAAAWLGSTLQVWLQTPLVIILSSFIFVLLAFSLWGFYEVNLPKRWQKRFSAWNHRWTGGNYLSVFAMGMFSTLIVSPCVSAPLAGVLLYISQTGDLLWGASALFAIGVGMGIPLLLVGASMGRWLPKRGKWMEAIRKLFTFVMLGMAVWLMLRLFPEPMSTKIFTVVHDLPHLQQALIRAKSAHKPVLLDFYADWCESCVIMDKQVFAAPSVQSALLPFILLRADLSENTLAEQNMMQYFQVIAPPAILFFAATGAELKTYRIDGEVNSKELLARLPK